MAGLEYFTVCVRQCRAIRLWCGAASWYRYELYCCSTNAEALSATTAFRMALKWTFALLSLPCYVPADRFKAHPVRYYTAMGPGCTPLQQCLGRLSLPSFARRNKKLSILKCDFSYSCAAVDKISTDVVNNFIYLERLHTII